MSEHDETPSVEVDPVQDKTEEPIETDQDVPQESAEDTIVESSEDPQETPEASSSEEEDAREAVIPEALFLDPDEKGGEEIEDVPDVASVQALLFAEQERTAELQASLDAMAAERDDFKARLLRTAADMENFRKRKERERDEIRKYGSDKVIGDLLPAIDNLERALEHAEKSEEQSSIQDGVRMVQRQLITALEKHGIKSFSAVGQRFDPQLHEAIQQIETTEFETGVVMQEFQKGYTIHDRLLRPSMTVVAKNTSSTPELVEEPETQELPDSQEEGIEEAIIEMNDQTDGDLEESSESGSEAGS